MEDTKALYLDLLKRCLSGWIHQNREEMHAVRPHKGTKRVIADLLAAQGLQLARTLTVDPELRVEGRYWPATAHTMIGLKRLDNLQFCVEDALARNVPGDLIETGVWRGGATIFMRGILRAHGVTDRRVWVADSFEGLPPPNADQYPGDQADRHHEMRALAVSLEDVQANFERYGLLDDQVRFLQGWFRDTLPGAPIERLAVVRLDGDMYESTMDGLVNLYPKLSPGGYLIVDDYGAVPGCRQAVEDYRREHGIREEILPIDWTGVYWRRSGGG